MTSHHLCGLYRGVAMGALSSGQVVLTVPTLFGMNPLTASPCRPPQSSAVPDPGDAVWVMFEGGDPDFPVWVGAAS